MNFQSDNTAPVNPEVMQAILQANQASVGAYGNDPITSFVRKQFDDIFFCETTVFFTSTGTSSNAIALASLVPAYGAIYCHEEAHINTDECGAPELATGGAKLIPVPGEHGKMSVEILKSYIERDLSMRPHASYPGAISLSQCTEAGTVYQLEELQSLTSLAHHYGLHVHMDGARFANALVSTGMTPDQLTWRSGVDVLSFGGTKNGAMAAESIVYFNRALSQNVDLIQKRFGQLSSKMRYYSCQFQALFENDLWLKNASKANDLANQLSRLLLTVEGVRLLHPVEGNEVFVYLPDDVMKGLREKGVLFYDWGIPGDQQYRFVTSFYSNEADLQNLESICKQL